MHKGQEFGLRARDSSIDLVARSRHLGVGTGGYPRAGLTKRAHRLRQAVNGLWLSVADWDAAELYCSARCYPCMKKTRKMKPTRASAKKRVARSAKKPTRSAALTAKQYRKQSAAVKRKPVVDRTPAVTAAPDRRRSMPFLFWLVLPLTMMSMWWGIREAREGS